MLLTKKRRQTPLSTYKLFAVKLQFSSVWEREWGKKDLLLISAFFPSSFFLLIHQGNFGIGRKSAAKSQLGVCFIAELPCHLLPSLKRSVPAANLPHNFSFRGRTQPERGREGRRAESCTAILNFWSSQMPLATALGIRHSWTRNYQGGYHRQTLVWSVLYDINEE